MILVSHELGTAVGLFVESSAYYMTIEAAALHDPSGEPMLSIRPHTPRSNNSVSKPN